jgi:hypothetical protein
MKASSIYIFEGEDGTHSPNYIGRVRTGGGSFVDPVNKPVEVQDGDVLLKTPDSPWFAHFRDTPETDAPTGESTDPEKTPEPAPGDKTEQQLQEEEAGKVKTLDQTEPDHAL